MAYVSPHIPSPTHLDLIQALWDKEGPLALGWIVAIFLAIYVVFLHSRIGKLYKEYNEFVQKSSERLIPLIESATKVMQQTITVIDAAGDDVSVVRERQEQLISQLQIIVNTFIETKTFWFNKDSKRKSVKDEPSHTPKEAGTHD